MRLWLTETRKVVSIHHCFYFADPLSLALVEIKLVFGFIAALFEFEEDEEACEVIYDVIV